MGKSTPEPPKPPDPIATAQAQAGANLQTAEANAWLGNVNTITPLGSVTYKQIGTQRVPGHWEKNPNGKGQVWIPGFNVPQFQATQTLSSDQQRLLDQQEKLGQNLNTLAIGQVGNLSGLLSKPVGDMWMPQGNYDLPDAPKLNSLAGANLTPNYQSSIAQGDIQKSIGPNDYEKARSSVENAMMARLQPQIDRDRSAMLAQLANQGVATGSQAYRDAIDAFNRNVADQRTQVVLAGGQEQSRLADLAAQQGTFANAAQAQQFSQDTQQAQFYNQMQQQALQDLYNKANFGNQTAQQNYANAVDVVQQQNDLRGRRLQENMALRNQPINEISALMSGGQVSLPQFSQWNAPQMAAPPVAQSVYNSAALANQQYAMQVQQQNAQMGGLFGLGSSLIGGLFGLSDRRLKENIKRVGVLDNGLPVYLYTFKGDDEPRLGVMADEVEAVMPDAVADVGGFKAVDYARVTA